MYFFLQSEVSLKFYFAILIFAKNIKKLVTTKETSLRLFCEVVAKHNEAITLIVIASERSERGNLQNKNIYCHESPCDSHKTSKKRSFFSNGEYDTHPQTPSAKGGGF